MCTLQHRKAEGFVVTEDASCVSRHESTLMECRILFQAAGCHDVLLHGDRRRKRGGRPEIRGLLTVAIDIRRFNPSSPFCSPLQMLSSSDAGLMLTLLEHVVATYRQNSVLWKLTRANRPRPDSCIDSCIDSSS